MLNVIEINNLHQSVTERDLEALFAPFGNVLAAKVLRDVRSSLSSGVGFVRMTSHASEAVEALKGRPHRGQVLCMTLHGGISDQEEAGGMSGTINMQGEQVPSPNHVERRGLPGESGGETDNTATAPGQIGPQPGDFGDRGGSGRRGGQFFI